MKVIGNNLALSFILLVSVTECIHSKILILADSIIFLAVLFHGSHH